VTAVVAVLAFGAAGCGGGDTQGRQESDLTDVESQVAQLRLEVQSLRREVQSLRDIVSPSTTVPETTATTIGTETR
jgi:prefoldin subunit 5